MNIKDNLAEIVDLELNELQSIRSYNWNNVDVLVEDIVNSNGKTIWCGMGKSGHVCKKIVATMNSLGVESVLLHPSEALHGDIGIVQQSDIVVLVSKSGESDELLKIIKPLMEIGAKIYTITNSSDNSLARRCDCNIVLPYVKEALFENIIPTTSTTQMMIIGDAIAVCAARLKKFTKNQFAIYHSEGLLGRRLLLKIKDLMKSGEDNSVVYVGDNMESVVFEMCKKSLGGVCVVDKKNKLQGVFTDGDLRRLVNMESSTQMRKLSIDKYMTKNLISVAPNELVSDFIVQIREKDINISFYPVVENGELIGVLHSRDILKTGLY